MYFNEYACTKARIRRTSMGREREVGKIVGNGTDGSSSKSTRMRTSTTSNTVLRAELPSHPLKTNRDVRKSK